MDEKKQTVTNMKGAGKNKNLEGVTKGAVRIKKEGKAAKVAKMFFVEDVKSVLAYVGTQVILPAMKRTFVEMVNSAANSLVNGLGTYTGSRRNISSNISYRPYYSDTRETRQKSNVYVPSRTMYDYGKVLVQTQEEADHVLDMMEEIVNQYPEATVADLYQLVNAVPNERDYDWGWVGNIDGAQVIQRPDGWFLIQMPKPRPITRD